jgi:hypothetical protein
MMDDDHDHDHGRRRHCHHTTTTTTMTTMKKGTWNNLDYLVHCSAGISRSPMVVAVYLMKRKGMPLKAALGQIIHVPSQISPNALKKMVLELYGSNSVNSSCREKYLFEEPKEQPNKELKVSTAVVATNTRAPLNG